MEHKMWNVVKNPLLVSLAEKAGMQPYYDAQEYQMARFMEVVVKECAQFVDPVTRIHMFKHFGIKEQAVPGISNDVVILKDFIVLYREDKNVIGTELMVFTCEAEDSDHAEEQFQDAYPDDRFPDYDLLWVVQGTDIDAAFDDYYDNGND